MQTKPRSITLDFADAENGSVHRCELSSVVQVGRDLWFASDEGATLERLSPTKGRTYGHHRSFELADYIDLPDPNEEVDIEGLAYAAGYLWLAGSHSVRRKDDDPDAGTMKKRINRLRRTSRRGNRYLLARIPVVRDGDGGDDDTSFALAKHIDPNDGTRALHAARLPGGRRRNALTDALRDDDHLAPYLEIPGKENGFDIEGLAVVGDRVFLGLRGPVLRGWAVVLSISIEADPEDDTRLRLRPIGPKQRLYEKHFLDLCGLGVRELCADGGDLLILAGPTMELDGRASVFRWPNVAAVRGDSLTERDVLETVLDLPYGVGEKEGVEHPEGLAFLDDGGRGKQLVVVYDAPGKHRRRGRAGVDADVYDVG